VIRRRARCAVASRRDRQADRNEQLVAGFYSRGWHETTAAKKGGDKPGFSRHKKLKGDKVVAFCDRRCNVIAPSVSAPGNRNESPLLRDALPRLTCIARAVVGPAGTIESLDGVYDCRKNRKDVFNRDMVPNINPNSRGRKHSVKDASCGSTRPSLKCGSVPSSGFFRLGRQVPSPAAALRAPQPSALRLQDAGRYDDQSAALQPQLIALSMFVFHVRRMEKNRS